MTIAEAAERYYRRRARALAHDAAVLEADGWEQTWVRDIRRFAAIAANAARVEHFHPDTPGLRVRERRVWR